MDIEFAFRLFVSYIRGVKKCPKCGQEHPESVYVSSSGKTIYFYCPACRREIVSKSDARRKDKAKQYAAENKERIAARRAAYYAENRAEILARQAAYVARTKDDRKASDARYRAANLAQVRARQREYRNRPDIRSARLQRGRDYYRDNRERLLADKSRYAKENRDKVRAVQAKRRARKRMAEGAAFARHEVLRGRLALYGGRCWVCGKPADTLDHVIPLAATYRNKPGMHVPANLRPCCRSCNSAKNNRNVHIFLAGRLPCGIPGRSNAAYRLP